MLVAMRCFQSAGAPYGSPEPAIQILLSTKALIVVGAQRATIPLLYQCLATTIGQWATHKTRPKPDGLSIAIDVKSVRFIPVLFIGARQSFGLAVASFKSRRT